jgi:hypothetical protein
MTFCFSAKRIAKERIIAAAAVGVVSPGTRTPVPFPEVHIGMCAVVAYLVLAKEPGVAGGRLSLNRLPIVVGIIVKHDAPGAALKDNAVAGFSHDIVLYLMPAVPMEELHSVIRAAIVACAIVAVVMAVFVRVAELGPDMRRTGAAGASVICFHSSDPTKGAKLEP